MSRGGTRRPWNTPQRRQLRWWVLLGSLITAAVAVVGRAVQLQAIEGEHWAAIAAEQQRGRTPLPARRGGIYDRNGVPLALTHETFAVAVAPRELRDPAAAMGRLASVLGLSEAEARRATDRSRRWVVLPGRFTAEQRKQLGGVRGVHFERKLDRFYPQGDVGREIIGAVSGDHRALGGIEQQFDRVLRGTAGYSVVRRDARGGAQSTIFLPVVPPTDGADVHLTIDFRLQEIADGALAEAIRSTGAAGGDLLLADPRSGELLAAVSRRVSEARSLAAITEPYEPGSTLKPFVVAALLGERKASLDDVVNAENGVWQVGRRTIRDVRGYDRLTLRDALRVSSNIAIVKLANNLSPGEQYRYLRDFGFGTPTGIEYPAESSGRLRHPARWSALSQNSLAMGYELSVTPLQLLMAYGALANGGVLREPRLIREVRAPDGAVLERSASQPLRRVLSPEVARAITDVLVAAVSDGTATRASLTTFEVAGKTGTARRTGAGGRYDSGSYTASFVGYFPAREPQLVIFVKLDQPRGAIYGGLTAAPVTRETLQGILAAHTRAFSGTTLLTARRMGGEVVAQPRPQQGLVPSVAAREGPFVFVLADGIPAPDSSRAKPATVPTLKGLPMRDAVRRAHALGLRVQVRGYGPVERTQPAAGATLPAGDTLLLIGRGE
jgi:cell division protein FtsI (penicillin-binding protein 3)